MLIVAITTMIFGVLFFVLFLYISDGDIISAIICTILPVIITILLGMRILSDEKPTEKDVLEGKATYQETLHVINNDTIKTYKIVWRNTHE